MTKIRHFFPGLIFFSEKGLDPVILSHMCTSAETIVDFKRPVNNVGKNTPFR